MRKAVSMISVCLLISGVLFTNIGCASAGMNGGAREGIRTVVNKQSVEDLSKNGEASVPVPLEYQPTYDLLNSKESEIKDYLDKNWDGKKNGEEFSAELLVANSNRGEVLLQSETMKAVKVNLATMKSLGVTGVDLAIQFPILVTDFPRSDEYLNFYIKVAEEVRKNGLKLLVGCQSTFTDPVFGQLPVDFSHLTQEQYLIQKRQMIETIIQKIKPDYLTIENEPLTQQNNTGLDFSVNNAVSDVNYFLTGLNKSGVKIGAGTGTWDDIQYIKQYVGIKGLDFIDIHIYPVYKSDFLDKVIEINNLGKQSGKEVIVGETWLYKTDGKEQLGNMASSAKVFSRDVYSFWSPLDRMHINNMVGLSHDLGFAFTNFFWANLAFGNVDYNEATKNLSPSKLLQMGYQEAGQNMMANPPRLSATGEALQKAVK